MAGRRTMLTTAAAALLLVTAPATAGASASPESGPPPGAAVAGATAAGAVVADPTRYVDPMIGTGRGGGTVGEINNFPGVSTPLGMMQFSPDTVGSYAGYQYHSDQLRGFSLNHASVGCTAFGDVPILPITGQVTDPANRSEHFGHDDEHAELGSYAVHLNDSDVDARITASTRTGLATFGYPAGSTAQVLVKSGSSLSGSRAADVTVTGDREVSGSSTTGGFCGNGNQYTVYFDIVFDRPFSAHGTWQGGAVTAGSDTATGRNSGAYLTFDTTDDTAVTAKVAMSYVSVAGAKKNMAAEISGFDLDATAAQTRAEWRALLTKIGVGGGTDSQLTSFYTALYHGLLHPNTFNDVDGRYIGFDNEIHDIPAGHTQYATFSDWDTYRSLIPLQAMLLPKEAGDMGNSLLRDAQQQGDWWPRWPLANGTTSQMNGDNSVAVFANLSAFGAQGLDIESALPIMVKGATRSETIGWGWRERPGVEDYVRLGYAPNNADSKGDHGRQGASETLEWAIDDFGIAQLAAKVGRHDLAAEFTARSQNWQNIFNPATGYLQPRDDDGAYPAGPAFVTPPAGAFGQDGYDEGNAAQYNWLVPQNMAGLIAVMGGKAAAAKRLDTFFRQINDGPNVPYMWAGNEVDFGVPWVYNYLGQPAKTQDAVRRLQTQLYSPTPDGAPGNDDLGAQSSWYVWAALGMYPVTPGRPDLSLNTPMFSTAVISLGNGKTLTVNTPRAGTADHYISRTAVNGANSTSTALPPSILQTGGTVDVTLAATPGKAGKAWGTRPKDAPPSYSDAQVAAIGFTDPTGTLTVPTGSVKEILVGAAGTGLGQKRVTWKATAPAGVTVSPSSGLVIAPSVGQRASVVRISVDPGARSDFRAVDFSFATKVGGKTQQLPTTTVVVVNPGKDDTAKACITLGGQNQPAGLEQVENDDGVTTGVTIGGRPARATVGERSNYMYFDLDDRLIPGGSYSATVEVSYFDHGTGSWLLQYDSAQPDEAYHSTGSVTRTNTDTWKTATFTLNGAAFRSRENVHSDFRLQIGPDQAIGDVSVQASGAGLLAMDMCG
ncbi:GH92 family glycosyl hydrolase [Nakamurella lactea]|uniref:GH92 family glycosyl hydrolase n=1 Tax=Nakamurella lactea TaxID=459515 RepID=UPI001B7FAF1E|nr:GH92 family glycosyl hydrolase [Nakamurella lactea]